MATALTVQTTSASGIVLAAAVAADATGNNFINSGREMIEIINGSGSPITATFTTHGTYNVGSVAYPIADLAVSVGATSSKACGPFDRTLFNNPSTGNVDITWSAVTTVTCRVIALGTA